MKEFDELGERIARVWDKHRYAGDALPDIAANELDKTPLHEIVDYASILNWVGAADTLPYQMNIEATFGEPPVTLFWHPAFYIEALYWSSSTTTIHGHGFAGAFQVLAGASLQSLFEFTSQESTRAICRIGKLRQMEARVLRAGATQKILGGEDFVHSVFHLGYPSVTIVVRTHHRAAGRQYIYYRPGVALAYNYESAFDQRTNRLLQVARLQALLKSTDLRTTVARIGQSCELAASFRLLQVVQPILGADGRGEAVAEIIATLVKAGGYKVAKLAEAVNLERRLTPLWRARQMVVDDELRLCLALLLTRQDRRFVMSIVSDYTGTAEPSRNIAGWIRALAVQRVLNIPADQETEDMLAGWLGRAAGPASHAQGTDIAAVEAEAMRRLKSEALLAPLLSDLAA
jgi:hypothetical protein